MLPEHQVQAVPEPADLELEHLTKSFPGNVVAVDSLSLSVQPGELVGLLGPSGCGKTTTLRTIAGFVSPDSGTVRIRGVDITSRPPYKRDIGLVFQNYSLFPHMTVEDNVAYGLRMRHVPRSEQKERVRGVLQLMQLNDVERRYPAELSGGQQQRVALARATVIKPTVLLLDEPLSNLDAKLRQETRWEIRRLQKELSITTVLVTHDQEEALTMCDRVVVMNAGKLEQVGAPREIYERPTSLFVAEFIGEINLIKGVVTGGDERVLHLHTSDGWVTPINSLTVGAAVARSGDGSVTVLLRPEEIRILCPADPPIDPAWPLYHARIEAAVYLGATTVYSAQLDEGTKLRVLAQNRTLRRNCSYAAGSPVSLTWNPSACRVLGGL